MVSKNKCHHLKMQRDGNLVLYSLGLPIWASNTKGSGEFAAFQVDGNLVVYGKGKKPLWASGTDKKGAAKLKLQDDRNLVLYSETGRALWATDSSMPPELWKMVKFKLPSSALKAARDDPDAATAAAAAVVVCEGEPRVCAAAVVVVAILLESGKEKPWGKGNEFRKLGGVISDEAKRAGDNYRKAVKSWSNAADDFWEKVGRGRIPF